MAFFDLGLVKGGDVLLCPAGQTAVPERSARLEAQFAELLVVNAGQANGHQVGGPLRLGKGDAVADVVAAGEEHHQPVDAQGDPAVRRGDKLKRVQQEPETLAGQRLVDAQQAEYLLLKLRVVDTNGAAAGLGAVDHQVVRPGTAFFRVFASIAWSSAAAQ